jgi:GNAT superfamily N-acetyltransferase
MSPPTSAAGLVVRPLEPNDASAVSDLIRELGYARSPQSVLEWIADLGAAGRQAAFVACFDNQVVGWIEVSVERRLQSAPFALIGGLVVKEGFRGRGIGRRLCQHAEAWGWDRCVEKVRVTSRSTRADAHRFYERDGYEVVKTSLVFEKHRPN